MTIRHIVMWRVRGVSATERRANAERVRDAFSAMRGRIAGMTHLEVGIDQSGGEHACDVVLLSEFDDAASLAAYADHPDHVRAKEAAGNLRVARHQVDYIVV